MRQAIAVAALCFSAGVSAQTFAKAEMYLEHGLTADAQKEPIDVLHAPGAAGDKPKALNLLASIAIDKNNLKAAIEAWSRLIKTYPASPEAAAAKARLPILSSVLGQASEETINDAAARVLLRNGDFWAKDRDRIFRIDSSWIPNVESAVYWYDKVLAEFPGSPAAKVAYEEKMRTLLGWKDAGQYGEAFGVRAKPTVYLPILDATFREYEKAFPQAAALQAFRFQVAQAYWKSRDWAKTREWLQEIIDKDGSADSFYKDLAQRRLKKVEY